MHQAVLKGDEACVIIPTLGEPPRRVYSRSRRGIFVYRGGKDSPDNLTISLFNPYITLPKFIWKENRENLSRGKYGPISLPYWKEGGREILHHVKRKKNISRWILGLEVLEEPSPIKWPTLTAVFFFVSRNTCAAPQQLRFQLTTNFRRVPSVSLNRTSWPIGAPYFHQFCLPLPLTLRPFVTKRIGQKRKRPSGWLKTFGISFPFPRLAANQWLNGLLRFWAIQAMIPYSSWHICGTFSYWL